MVADSWHVAEYLHALNTRRRIVVLNSHASPSYERPADIAVFFLFMELIVDKEASKTTGHEEKEASFSVILAKTYSVN
ncbi:hypothetical protein PGLA_13030 [Paenibacillus glacialis]|uniref:Uncharacterized protein n=1 Tax=Paenibacillus glacialis TaxID=494026 RepID=A0A162K2U8_9BACL|nr:hypothetical protein PGLA_13030 [Paenibacillus glacialis]